MKHPAPSIFCKFSISGYSLGCFLGRDSEGDCTETENRFGQRGSVDKIPLYLELTRLPVTTYFRKLIAENSSREKPNPANRRLYVETNMICSNLQQILRNPTAMKLDRDAVKRIQFLRERMPDQIFCVQNLLDLNCKDEW